MIYKIMSNNYVKSRDFVFTLNNYDESDINKLLNEDQFRYIVIGKETAPTTGTRHLQGYLYYKDQTTELKIVKIIKNLTNKQPYVAARLKESTPKAAADYCKKDKSQSDIYERGELPTKKNTVNKLAQSHGNSIIAQIKQGSTLEQIMENNEKDYLKYHNAINELYRTFKPKQKGYNLLDDYKELRSFQMDILEILKHKPDDRKILWIYDAVGNTGKSQLADHICDNMDNFITINNGKTADIAYLWNGENIIVDLSRTTSERVNYEIIEQLKNGRVFSTKYESEVKRYKRPHLIVLSNFKPDIRTMSYDRWDIREITRDYKLVNITESTIKEYQEVQDYETTSNSSYSSDDLDYGIGNIKASMRKNYTI